MLDLFPPRERHDRVLLGTSGWSFADWVGPFYPPGMASGRFLPYYASHFHAVEVNATYYRMPSFRMMEQIEKKTPPGFHFVVKLHRPMTHEGSRDPSLYREFLDVLRPLQAAGKYDGLLAQFPWGFKRTPENVAHVEAVRALLPEEPLFVEFRNDSWIGPDLEPWLGRQRLGYCAVDEPQLPGLVPPVTMLTTEDAYVRLHGRNARSWWSGDRSTRYDYNYSEEELREWLHRIAELADKARRTYLFFNNCHAGQAARNAKLMQELLRQQRLVS
jgi:uncharacterized protein YecE (DUF72 family)